MKILVLDIETAPNLAHVWRLWKQNVAINQIIESGYVLCWAAKWYGEDKVYFDSVKNGRKPRSMLLTIHKMINDCDAIIHYNGTKFDMPTLNQEFLLHGLPPPSPYKHIDLLTTVRRQFNFPSNKLDYVAQQLKIGKKTSHQGHELWIKCMNNDKAAWQTMQEYNENDVVLTEMVYEALKPWIKGHPNHGTYENGLCCTNCGSLNFKRSGWAYTQTNKYQRYACKDCGTWFKGTNVDSSGEPKKMRAI